ncbi:MAG TPA: hypothetical protein VH475_13440 [Tepidisphaeraceae bacterium]|jgi:hypothetical protein
MTKSTPPIGLIGISGLILLVGCANQEPADAPTASATPAAARVSPADLPPGVRDAFMREFPDAGITNVTHLSAETGAPLYRLTFIQNGRPGSATYFMNGERLPQPAPADLTPYTPRPLPNDSGVVAPPR